MAPTQDTPANPLPHTRTGATTHHAVGKAKQQIEIPLDVVADNPQKVDLSASCVGNKYNALPWKEFVSIKLDARNLMEADVKTALTELDWFGKVHALDAGKQVEAEMSMAAKSRQSPVAPK